MEPQFPHNPNGLVTVPKGEAESVFDILTIHKLASSYLIIERIALEKVLRQYTSESQSNTFCIPISV